MTTTRAYRKTQSAEESWAELQRCAGQQFDPQVVAAFRATFPDGEMLPT
jgi:HD-GYP domain-containing protein (c-di-GMP phosphodiesterase class II)